MPSFGEELETLRRWRRFPGRERLHPPDGRVALTFDDGPDPDATPAVLEALERTGSRATFFLVGEQVAAHRSLAQEVALRGHEVGLHCFRHVEHDQLRPEAALDDLGRALATLEAAAGARPRLCRPPYGRFAEASYAAAREAGLEPVYWSAWGGDWEAIPAERIADLVVRDLAPGLIVLLHDSARYAYRPSARPTAEALPAIAEAAAAAGLGLGPIGAGTAG
jgi:peptidoglycan-N-acetylglucosamine deacetylase